MGRASGMARSTLWRCNSLSIELNRLDMGCIAMDMSPEILLKAYVRHQSEDAFRELIARTLDEVYSTSLRIVQGTPHLASEVAVRVYIELARKAHRLGNDIVLASWLRERTCKMAVTVLRAEDRPVDRAVLKREKDARSIPPSVDPAPPGLALRIGYGIFLNRPRRKRFRLSLPTIRWPAWIRPRHLGGAAVCVLAILVWWNNPFHRRNRIIKSEGSQMTPSSFAQLASPDDEVPLPSLIATTNDGINPMSK